MGRLMVLVYGPLTMVLLAAPFTACDDDATGPAPLTRLPLGTHSFTITATADDVERSIEATLTVRRRGEVPELEDASKGERLMK